MIRRIILVLRPPGEKLYEVLFACGHSSWNANEPEENTYSDCDQCAKGEEDLKK